MKSSKELLVEAKTLITDPAKWTTELWARDEDGFGVDTCSATATCWCAWGALLKVTGHENREGVGYNDAWAALQASMNSNVTMFNDTGTHENVLEAYDKAIESLEEQ